MPTRNILFQLLWNRLIVLIVLSLTLVSTSVVAAEAADDIPPVKFAVLAFRPKPETLARWQPLVDHLNASNIGRRFTLEALTYAELEAAVKTRQVGVVLTQPAHYILLSEREGLHSPLATLIGKEAGHQLANFGGVIAVRAQQNDIRELSDLRGKRIAVSDTESLGGYLMQAMELSQRGIELPNDVQLVTTGVPHDRTLYELLAGRADAAFARTGVLEAMQREGKLDLQQIRVLNSQAVPNFPFALSTRLYPEWALSAMPWLGDDLMRKIAVAILGLPHGGPVTTAARIHGFTIPGNYQPVEELMRRLRVPPFDTTPSFTIQDVWQHYQAGITLFASMGFAALLLLSLALLRSNRGLQAEQAQSGKLLKQLESSEARYRGIVTSSPDWIWEINAQGAYTFVSPKVWDILGYTPEEVLGKTPFELMTPEDAERVSKRFSEIMHTQHEFFTLENTNLHKDGRPVVLETSGVPILGEHQEFLGYRGIDRDITSRKLAEKELETYRTHLENLVAERTGALQAAETRYRTIAEFTYDWETWISSNGTWLFCSPSCTRLTGYSYQEFMERPALFLEIVHPDDRASMARHLEEYLCCPEGIGQITFRILHRNGSVAWIEHACQPVFNNEGEHLGRRASNRDITARIEAEQALSKARDAVVVATVAKNAFLANMSHEMRTPLHQISGMAYLIKRESLTTKQQERMEVLESAVRHMTGMVERILELAKIEAGKFELEDAPIEMDALLGNVIAMAREKAGSKPIQLLTEATHIPAGLQGDVMHLQTALSNLVDNAVKFTEIGSVTIAVKPVTEDGKTVLLRFEVTDTGMGVPPDALPRLFGVFEQADNSSTRQYSGAGIGLAIVEKLAQIMGGEAGCRSTLGVGSIFWFTAKLKKA